MEKDKPITNKDSLPMKKLRDFWNALNEEVTITINDIDRMRTLIASVLQRCQQFVDEARQSRNEWRERFEEKNKCQTIECKRNPVVKCREGLHFVWLCKTCASGKEIYSATCRKTKEVGKC